MIRIVTKCKSNTIPTIRSTDIIKYQNFCLNVMGVGVITEIKKE
jgi:hypothetical protein